MFQLCLSRYVLIIPCILVLSFEFDFVWSTRYPRCFCPCQSCLDVIKDYYLSLRPHRVLVPPSCVHRDSCNIKCEKKLRGMNTFTRHCVYIYIYILVTYNNIILL